MSDTVVVKEQTVLVTAVDQTVNVGVAQPGLSGVIKEPTVLVTVVEQPVNVCVAQPGLPGPPGPMPPDALRVSQRLAEFDTPEAKASARINLELQWIDCGEF